MASRSAAALPASLPSRLWEGVVRLLEGFVLLLVLAMVLDVTFQIVASLTPRGAPSWTDVLAQKLLVWIGLLGGSVAVRRKAHLGIDALVTHFPGRAQTAVEGFVAVVIILFSAIVMVYGGWLVVSTSLSRGSVVHGLTGLDGRPLPLGYTYLCLPIAGVFNVLFGVEMLFQAARSLRSGLPETEGKTA